MRAAEVYDLLTREGEPRAGGSGRVLGEDLTKGAVEGDEAVHFGWVNVSVRGRVSAPAGDPDVCAAFC